MYFMKKYLLLVFSILLLSNCKNGIKEKKVYDKEGKIYEVYNYQTSKDTTNYQLTRYYKNGNIEFILPYRANNINGIGKLYNPNGSIEFINTYKNSQLNGVSYRYDEETEELCQEILFLNDEPIVIARIGQVFVGKDTMFLTEYRYPVYDKDTSFKPVGSITTELDGTKDIMKESYFLVNAKDTIVNGSEYEINIEFLLGTFKNLTVELRIGELKKDLNFIDSSKTNKYVGQNNKLSFCINKYHLGTNLILGKMKLIKNGKDISSKILSHPQIKEFIFYKQFEVIE